MPHRVLDIVAEDPQEQHVAAQVQPAAVQEHRGDERQLGRHQNHPRRQRPLAGDHRRYGAQRVDDPVLRRAEAQLPQEGDDARRDQRHRDVGKADPAERVFVLQRNQHAATP
jgi:hypothetical protein